METLWESYILVKGNDGAPGIDGVTFDALEKQGEEEFLKQIRDELVSLNSVRFKNEIVIGSREHNPQSHQ